MVLSDNHISLYVMTHGNEVIAMLTARVEKGDLRSDNMVHAFTFLCFVGIYILKRMSEDLIFQDRVLAKIFSIIIASAILIEAVQFFLPFKASNPGDLVSNLIEAGLATLIIWMFTTSFSTRSTSKCRSTASRSQTT